ncbi:MAG: hypothetical protein U0231_01965 [Nitrospiraceae bacterium]
MNPPDGSTQTITTETDQLVVTAQAAGLAAGTYSGVVYLAESGINGYSNMIRVPVSLTVTGNATAAIAAAPAAAQYGDCAAASACLEFGGKYAASAPTDACLDDRERHGVMDGEYRIRFGRISRLRRDIVGKLYVQRSI